MNYDESISIIENNLVKINESSEKLLNKSNDVKVKIDMLTKKNNIKLDESVDLLDFQNRVLHNELFYLSNIKSIIVSNLSKILLQISEGLTMLTLSVVSMYKDIIDCDNKPVKISNKKDKKDKIIHDIVNNLDFLKEILNEIKEYNKKLYANLIENKFHCNTLNNTIDIKCMHIELEYNKTKNDLEQTLKYFIDFTTNMSEQIDNMTIHNFIT
jgi:hypothetical protein